MCAANMAPHLPPVSRHQSQKRTIRISFRNMRQQLPCPPNEIEKTVNKPAERGFEKLKVSKVALPMKTKTSALGLSAKPTKTPWHLRFAPTVKGIVSFVQNLLPSRTQKEAFTAAAVLAGIGLLAAPFESAQAQSSSLPVVSEVIVSELVFLFVWSF